jgi:hypothetical protein
MIQNRFIIAAAALLPITALAFAQGGKEDNPGSAYIVINNTNLRLSCAYRWAGAGQPWHGWFQIPSAGNWRLPADRELSFQCASPVRRRIYPLKLGARYSLLRATDGAVDLVRVTAGH